jgi:hypothetical protein
VKRGRDKLTGEPVAIKVRSSGCSGQLLLISTSWPLHAACAAPQRAQHRTPTLDDASAHAKAVQQA